MSLDIYYEARREKPLTAYERTVCDEIMNRYSAEYPFGKNMMILDENEGGRFPTDEEYNELYGK